MSDWPRADCRLCGESNLISHVLDDGLCPVCARVVAGDPLVTTFRDCPKCGTRMYSTQGGYAGGGAPGCCWAFPVEVRP